MKKSIILLIIISILCISGLILTILQNRNNNNVKLTTIKPKGYEGVLEMIIEVNNKELIVDLEDNESAKELLDKLSEKEIKIKADDYSNFEKVGDLGFNLTTNDQEITTKPGDVILYQGNKLCLYYGTNTYSFTKLGHINNVNQEKKKKVLGNDSVELVLKMR